MCDGSTVAELVARAGLGDQGAWDELVERFAPLVWSVCSRYGLARDVAEEIGQNVWLSLVEKLPTLREPAALPGWLATTTRRECLRVSRSYQRRWRYEQPQDDQEPVEIEGVDVADGLLRAERDHALREALAQLQRPCRDLLALLTASPPLPYAEIARRLDMRIGSIGPSRKRCLDKLRQCPALVAWLRESASSAAVGSTE
jgi:RNA polymerase sigma factor (sigma-70 family)